MIVLTDEQIAQVSALSPYLTQERIADALGISQTTFENILLRDPRVAGAYKKGRAEIVAQIAGSLIGRALGGDITAQIFFLKTQGGWREKQADETVRKERPVLQIVKHKDSK